MSKPFRFRLPQSWLLILALSLVTVSCILQGEFLLMPRPLGYFGWFIYRLAYCFVLPARVAVMALFPENDNHFWPAGHYVALTLVMPIYLDMLRRGVTRFREHYQVGWLGIQMRTAECGPRNEIDSNRNSSEVSNPLDPDRRQFLLGAAAGTLSLATSGVGSYAALVEPEKLKIREYTIAVRDLPAAFEGLRLVHVSDTHYGPFVSMRTLEHAVEVVNGLHPDLVILTGDYMHRTRRSLRPGIGVLSGMKARLGAVAVLGNHDHWEGTRQCYEAFDGIKVPLIDNRHLYLTPDGLAADGRRPSGPALCLAGVGDLWEDEVSFRKALSGVPDRVPRLMLAHNPDVAEMIDPALRVDLMLSGHTHGGQIALPVLGPPKVGEYGYKYLGGLCHGPSCPVIVSRGVGMSGLPLRLNVPPELGVITLTQA